MKHWWLRGLDENNSTETCSADPKTMYEDFKMWLDWNKKEDSNFFDRSGVSLLIYAVCANNVEVTKYLLDEISETFKNDSLEKRRRIESCISKNGYLHVGIPGSCTALIGAMTLASPEIVHLLLENGADAYAIEISGNNPLMCACAFNRVGNVKLWLKKFPDWDLEARNSVTGAAALATAIYMGPNRLQLTEVLLNQGAKVEVRSHLGGSIFTNSCIHDDADPRVVKLLLKHNAVVNYQTKATSVKWKLVRVVANIAVRMVDRITCSIGLRDSRTMTWRCKISFSVQHLSFCQQIWVRIR